MILIDFSDRLLDPSPTYFIQIQKMRLTKVMRFRVHFFTDHGIELIGSTNLEKKIAASPVNQKPAQEQNIMKCMDSTDENK